MELRSPLSVGSISLRLYPHNELDAPGIVAEMRAQAAMAAAAGFDGVMTSEHHGGFAGYVPNPIQSAGWLLEAMPTGWAAPCPLLLPLRPAALVAEEIAWLAARFPGRVGVGVAAGSLVDDFEIMELTKDDLTNRFDRAFTALATALDGTDPGRLGSDAAIARCTDHPVPMLSAAMSVTAVRRAARLGAGLLLDSLSAPERARTLIDAYRAAGGVGACVLIRRVWIGPPPTEQVERQVDLYRGYADPAAQSHWQGDQLLGGTDADSVAARLSAALDATGADALNLRLHSAGIGPGAIRDQIGALGDVVPLVSANGPTR